nr:hypothetical protein [Tanacetum cinerariifolium]
MTNNLNLFDLGFEDNCKSDDPYDDRRDKESEKSKGINPTSSGGTKNTSFTRRDEDEHLDDSELVKAVNDLEKNAPVSVNSDRRDCVNLRRSYRKASMPGKLSDFHIDTKVKTPIEVKTSNVKKNGVVIDEPLVGFNNY